MSMRTELKHKAKRRRRRKLHIRQRVFGTAERPRLTVFRSLKNIYGQLIDDVQQKTLASASTRDTEVRSQIASGGNCAAAKAVGKVLAGRVQALGLQQAQFDRNGYRFHGRVKALVEAMREAGIKV
jgi:large subunit ribosomal protein L18